MKRLNPVNIEIDGCMDADDYGHRLTECINQISESANVVNLVKIKIGDNLSADTFNHIIKDVSKKLQKRGAKNCVYVPIKKGLIEDITVEYIEVVDNEVDT